MIQEVRIGCLYYLASIIGPAFQTTLAGGFRLCTEIGIPASLRTNRSVIPSRQCTCVVIYSREEFSMSILGDCDRLAVSSHFSI